MVYSHWFVTLTVTITFKSPRFAPIDSVTEDAVEQLIMSAGRLAINGIV